MGLVEVVRRSVGGVGSLGVWFKRERGSVGVLFTCISGW